MKNCVLNCLIREMYFRLGVLDMGVGCIHFVPDKSSDVLVSIYKVDSVVFMLFEMQQKDIT